MRNEAKVESGQEIKNCLCPTEQGPNRGFDGPKALEKYFTPLKPYSVDGTKQSLQQGCHDSVT